MRACVPPESNPPLPGSETYSGCRRGEDSSYWCATSLHPDGSYDTWDTCEVDRCPVEGALVLPATGKGPGVLQMGFL